jgi:CPA1 family monovalent cation:H+ antiporter
VLIEQAHGFSVQDILIAIAWTTLIVVVARFVWVFPATYIPRWLSKSLAARDPSPPWQSVFLLSFTGIRGVVSLAAALGLPFATMDGSPFPHRDLILFITFGVIVVTLVGQGLMLPAVVRWLGLPKLGKEERIAELQEELGARQAALEEVTKRLDAVVTRGGLPAPVVEHLRTRNMHRQQIVPANFQDGLDIARTSAGIKKNLIDAERDFIFGLLRDGKITDEARRRIEYELDLEEASLANRAKDGGGWI